LPDPIKRCNLISNSIGSKPFTAAVTKRPFQYAMVVLSIIFALETWLALASWQQAGYFTADLVKFEPVELRASNLSAGESSTLADFGLVKDGCKTSLSLLGNRMSAGSFIQSSFVLRLNQTVRANGYYFTTANGSVDNDPVRWTVKASVDNGTSWKVVGASVWRLTTDGTTRFYPQLTFKTPMERGVDTVVDFRRRWQWGMVSIVRSVVLFSGCIASFCFALVGREDSARHCWIVMFSVLGLCFTASAVGYGLSGQWREAAEKWINVPECFVIPIVLSFFESKCIVGLFLFSALGAVNSLLADCVIYGKQGQCFVINSFENIYIFMFTAGFASLITFFNHWTVTRAQTLMLEDRKIYDGLWSEIQQDPQAGPHLQLLRGLSKFESDGNDDLGASMSAEPRQYDARFLKARAHTLGRRSTSRAVTFSGSWAIALHHMQHNSREFQARISSLDQLFAQAFCVHPFLILKVREWAAKSNGYVMLRPRGLSRLGAGPKQDFIKYSDVGEGQQLEVKWCNVKTLQRTIEKVVRAYAQVKP
jgi:hypothetical protein